MTLPPAHGPLIAWYGDDFTGAAAVAEVLEFAGFPAVLFLGVPSAETRTRFAHCRCFGIAGDARTRGPEWMTAELPAVFQQLIQFGAPVLHYKICSTLDSAPHIGSVGRAAEIGLRITGAEWAPLIVASPRIGRYQSFGNLFARGRDGIARLDRHPTMAVHPVTPMTEADVRRHLAAQTDLPQGLVDVLDLWAGQGPAALARERTAGAQLVTFDMMEAESQAEAGRALWQAAARAPLFALGSQGVEDALIAAWVAAGHVIPPTPRAAPVPRIAVVSGSCSPDTARQITLAEERGFAVLRLDATRAVDAAAWATECGRVTALALQALGQGRDPLVCTARGPDDPTLAGVSAAIAQSGQPAEAVNAAIGRGLGLILRDLAEAAQLRRVAVAGGDTSSHATGALGLVALTVIATVGPAVPLLQGHAADAAQPAPELVLKGGQMGAGDLFAVMRDGS